MIREVMCAMEARDYRALAACFGEACDYADFCPCVNGGRSFFLQGSAGIELFFHQRFVSRRFEIAQAEVESETAATFFCTYDNGPYVYARLSIEAFCPDGRIAKAVVHPI